SVPDKSLSIVLGTPTIATPIWERRAATPNVSSPPQAITASSPSFSMLAITSDDLSTLSPNSLGVWKGLVRDEPRLVPPSRSQRRTVDRSSGTTSKGGFSKLNQPSPRPTV